MAFNSLLQTEMEMTAVDVECGRAGKRPGKEGFTGQKAVHKVCKESLQRQELANFGDMQDDLLVGGAKFPDFVERMQDR